VRAWHGPIWHTWGAQSRTWKRRRSRCYTSSKTTFSAKTSGSDSSGRCLVGMRAFLTPPISHRDTRARTHARTHARTQVPAPLLHAHASATAVLTAAARPHHTHSHSSHSMSPQRELSLAVLALRNARPGSHSNPTQLASFLHSSAFDSTQDCLQAVGPQGLSLSLAKTPTGKRRALGQVHAV
jgi:hypothetical protein